jgi:hypothetical protein
VQDRGDVAHRRKAFSPPAPETVVLLHLHFDQNLLCFV